MADPVRHFCLETPFGRFQLGSQPDISRGAGNSAWCAADTLLLDAAKALIDQQAAPESEQHPALLTVNDNCGALTIPTSARVTWTDSALACTAITRNASANNVAPPIFLDSVSPFTDVIREIDLVLLRVPKQLNYFEYQLNHLAQHLPTGTTIVAAGMDKHLSPRTASLLEKHLGTTTRHRGQRKARLFSSTVEKRADNTSTAAISYFCELLNAQLYSLPNVFSQQSLDQGARLMLEVLTTLDPVERVIDLGCGNGVLGLYAGMHGGASNVIFCDESAMAVAAASQNAQRLFATDGAEKRTNYALHWGDGLQNFTGAPVHRIIVNPPFHTGHRVNPRSGSRLLAYCARHLLPKGELLVVANRHLNYQPTLKKHFAHIERVAQNKKFVVLQARKPLPVNN